MSAIVLRGGERIAAVDPADRGLAYGDGVFETLRVHAGAPVWWEAHWARLRLGLARLGIPEPDEQRVRGHASALLSDAPPRAVLKLIVSRGVGGRGYAPPASAEPTVVLSAHEAPPALPPLRLRWCATRWAKQPALAAIKHLNRLEQVLARAEWQDAAIHEGLVLGADGNLVSATAANVFIRHGEEWLTPPVDDCGIAGLMRAWVLANAPRARVASLAPDHVEAADEVFLCNAVRGILPVRALGGREWADWPGTQGLRQRLAGAEPAFADREH